MSYCCVCKSHFGTPGNLLFHVLPTVPENRAKWIQAIGREVSKCSKVCSNHFTVDDYKPHTYKKGPQFRRLKPGSVPTLYMSGASSIHPPQDAPSNSTSVSSSSNTRPSEESLGDPKEPILVEVSSEESVDDPKEPTFTEEKMKTFTSNISLEELAVPGESVDTKMFIELNSAFNSGGAFCSCCFTQDTKSLKFRLGDKCFENISAKDAILKILPCIDFPLMDSDAICIKCFETLIITLQFIKTFMNVNSCRLARSVSQNKGVEVINVDSDSVQNTVEREDVEADGNKSGLKEQSVVQLTNGKKSDDSFKIEFIVEDEEALSKGVEVINVDSDSVQNTVEREDVDANESKSGLKEQSVVKLTNGKKSDDSFKIEFIVEDEEALSEEERYFDEVSSYCATKTMFKMIDHRVFKESETKLFNRIVTIPNVHETLLIHFFFDIYKDITVFQHSSTCREGNKRLLLLGKIHYNFCSLCEKQFASQDDFKKHLTEKCQSSEQNSIEYFFKTPSLTSLKCDVCGASFNRLNNKRAHMTKCFIFECFYCKEKLNGNQLFEHSKTLHEDPKPFKCSKCAGAFRSYKKYKEHNCDRAVCEKCGKTPTSIQTHQCNSTTRLRQITRICRHCNERIPTSEYKEHIRLKHRIYCCHCKRGFFTVERLEAHKKSSCRTRKQLCNICGKLFAKGHMRQHLKIHEQRVKSFECETCKRKYFSAARLQYHKKTTHFGKEVICEYCGITLRERNMKNHILLKHDQSICKLKCPVPSCEKLFSRRDYLSRHVARHQRGVRRFSLRRKISADQTITCKFCLKEFKGVNRLKTHLVHHLRLSRFKCRFCTMTYTSYSNRLRHEKTFHKSQGEFKCNTCWKKEPSREKLNAHIESVHTLKKYKCENCGKAFSRHFQLNAHLVAEHVKPFEIEEERNYIFHKALSDYLNFDDHCTQSATSPTSKGHIEYEVESFKSGGEEYTDNDLEGTEDEDIIDESMYRSIKVDEEDIVPKNSEYRLQVKDRIK